MVTPTAVKSFQGCKLKQTVASGLRCQEKPGPRQSDFGFLDQLLSCFPFVVKLNNLLGSPIQIRHDKTDSGKQFAKMPFHFSDHTTRFIPTWGLIHERFVQHLWLVRRTPRGSGSVRCSIFSCKRLLPLRRIA